jgi:hypothetical protein
VEAVGAKRAPNAYYFVPLAAFDSIRLAILVTPLTKRKQPLPEAMAPDSTNMAIGRALEILDLVRRQAFTLAIADSFALVACWLPTLSLSSRARRAFQNCTGRF